MLSNKVAFGLMGLVALMGAAGVGAFVAARRAMPTQTITVPAPAVQPTTPPQAPAAVDATEATLDDSKPAAISSADKSATAGTIAPADAAREAQTPAPVLPRKVSAPAASSRSKASPPVSVPAPAVTSDPQRSAPAADARGIHAQAPVPMPAPGTAHPVEADQTGADRTAAMEPVPSVPPAPQFQEVTIPAESVIGLQIETAVSSETARMEDRVVARVSRDVRAEGRIAIPAGSKVLGAVSLVDRGGHMKDQARLGVRFHTVILADGTELPLQTETIIREGESPTNASATKVGGAAIGGAILGAILGGGKGAAIGTAVGAAGGTTAVMTGGRKAAQIAAGAPVTVKVLSPVTVTVERD